MKKNIHHILLIVILLFIFLSCTKKQNEVKYNYKGVLVSGQTVDLKFSLYFKDSHSKKIAKRRHDNFIHALDILFPSYKRSQLDKSKIKCLLQKTTSKVFYKTVDKIYLISIEYGK